MGKGLLKIEVTTEEGSIPIAGANIVIRNAAGIPLFEGETDQSGSSGLFMLETIPIEYTLDPDFHRPAYTVCEVDITADGFVAQYIHNVGIVDTETAILPVALEPQVDGGIDHEDIYIPPVGLLVEEEYHKDEAPPPAVEVQQVSEVIIPEYITVHLGAPTNTAARNVHVKFADYIKNVTSSEIYPTWPNSSLIANIHAITTFALNRIFTEWYRSRGFDFDITNSTAYDQYFREGGPIYQDVSQLVDEYFNVYAHRQGFLNPFFTQFCNGSTVTCPGLSQWGTVTLANRGLTPLQILRYYYPDDIVLRETDNIQTITESYPGTALRVGSRGEPVRHMQNFLNRIRVNFPLIPAISNPNGVFGADTESAVRTFQRTFNLTPDGIIGRATWNKILFIFVGVTKLAELDAEGIRYGIGTTPPTVVLTVGSRSDAVSELQFILNTTANVYDSVPYVVKDGIFGFDTKNAVVAFQKTFGLVSDGIVGPVTWNKLYEVYNGIKNNIHVPAVDYYPTETAPQYPGSLLKVGSRGPDVRVMQTFLNTIRIVYNSIGELVVDGVFGAATKASVIDFQQQFGLVPDGVIGPLTWNRIVEQFMLLTGNKEVRE